MFLYSSKHLMVLYGGKHLMVFKVINIYKMEEEIWWVCISVEKQKEAKFIFRMFSVMTIRLTL